MLMLLKRRILSSAGDSIFDRIFRRCGELSEGRPNLRFAYILKLALAFSGAILFEISFFAG